MAQRLTHKDEQRLQRARTAFMQNRADEAVRLYEKLLKRNPDHMPITTELAQIYAKLRVIEPADRLLQKVIQRQSSQGRIMALVGRTYDSIRNYESALKAYQLALQCELQPDVEVGVRTEIALASERTNDLVEAQVQVDQLLKSAPDSSATMFVAGLVNSRNGNWEVSESFLQNAIKAGPSTELVTAQAWYELGNVLDKQQRYDESFEAILTAKKIDLPRKSAAKKKSQWVAA